MLVAYAAVAIFLAGVCLGSSYADVTKMPLVVEAQERLNVPEWMRRIIPFAKVLGGAGLLIGLGVVGLGVAAAVGLTAYFAIAAGFHVRAKDKMKDTGPAAVLCL